MRNESSNKNNSDYILQPFFIVKLHIVFLRNASEKMIISSIITAVHMIFLDHNIQSWLYLALEVSQLW